MKDYYNILEVEENSTPDEIKKSYRRLSKKYHPDVNPDGAEKFKEISEAYETLSDESKRKQYDNRKNNPFGEGINIDDLFGQFFNRGNRNIRRENKEIRLNIGVVDSYRGIKKEINYLRNIGCDTCNGSGGKKKKCDSCGGSGIHVTRTGNGFFSQILQSMCNTCGGSGEIILDACKICNGRGTTTKNEKVSIDIPRFTHNGAIFRLAGYGDYSNGDYGDLIIFVGITPQDGFERYDDDLVYTYHFDLESLQNDKIEVPHPDGELSISLPKVFDSSLPLRVRGKGFKGGRVGDFLIKQVVKFNRS